MNQRPTPTTAAHDPETVQQIIGLRQHLTESLIRLNDVIHDLEGRGVLTRDDVNEVLGNREAMPSIRAEADTERAVGKHELHTQREHVENSPVVAGELGWPVDIETTASSRARSRHHSTRRAIARHYGEVMEVLDRNVPVAAAAVRQYVDVLGKEAARSRVEAKELRQRLGVDE